MCFFGNMVIHWDLNGGVLGIIVIHWDLNGDFFFGNYDLLGFEWLFFGEW